VLHLEHPERLDLLDAASRDLMLNDLGQALFRYSTTLIGLRNGRLGIHCSGILVQIGGRHFVLTAGHCGSELDKYAELGLCLYLGDQPGNKHHFAFAKGAPPFVIHDNEHVQWGPDLALVPIPETRVGAITGYSLNAFYNLEKHRRAMVTARADLRGGFWAFVGVPALTSELGGCNPKFDLNLNWGLASNLRARKKGQFDYIDFRIPETATTLPKHLQGMSGGGLWRSR
jgi:hypothetical protein